MSYRSLIVLAASAAAAVTTGSAANAQAPAGDAASKPIARADVVRQINANYKTVDTNGDGGITEPEIAAAQARTLKAAEAQFVKRREEVFRKLDTNKDGQLNPAEFNAGSPPPQPRLHKPAEALSLIDTNKDKKVNVAEFGAMTLANFDKADTNHDGVVSVDEQKKALAAVRR